MTETSNNKEFTFFLNSGPKEIKEKENPSLEFIIIQNDYFHTKIKELEIQFQELVDEKNQFEESLR